MTVLGTFTLSAHAQATQPGYWPMGATILLAACLQGVSGIGFAMVCAPLAALFFPQLVPGPLLALSFPLALLTGLREFAQIDWRAARSAVLGRIAGAVLAMALLLVVPDRPMAVLFAVLILAAVALSVLGWQVAPTPRNVAVAGVASGLMGTITSAGAPPFAIVMHSLPPAQLRATLGCVFFAGTAVSLALLHGAGRFGMPQLALSLVLLPWALLGFWLSGPVARLLPSRLARAALLGLAALGGVGVLVHGLM